MKYLLTFFSAIILGNCVHKDIYLKIMEQKHNSSISKTLSGKYYINTLNGEDISVFKAHVVFNGNTNKVSGFLGCNSLLGNYTLRSTALKFSKLETTKMICKKEHSNIEKRLLKALKKPHLIYFEEKGFLLYNKNKQLLSAIKEQVKPNVSFEYSAISRGASTLIKINKKSVSLAKQHEGKHNIKACSDTDWNKLIKLLDAIETETVANLKAPSEKRFFDGAAIASLKITLNGTVYKSQNFDHGNPPEEIAALVKEILSISENIE